MQLPFCLYPLADFVILPITVGHWQAIEKATHIVLALAVHDKRWWSVNPTDTVPSFLESAFGKQGSRSPRKISRGKPITSLTFDWNKEGYRRLFLSSFRTFKHSWTLRFDTLLFLFSKENKVLKAESVCTECVFSHTMLLCILSQARQLSKERKYIKTYRK